MKLVTDVKFSLVNEGKEKKRARKWLGGLPVSGPAGSTSSPGDVAHQPTTSLFMVRVDGSRSRLPIKNSGYSGLGSVSTLD